MATDADFIEYVFDQSGLSGPGGLRARKMFGEYALYLRERVVALACDNQLFIKPTQAGRALLPQPQEGFPYPGARPWWHLADLDDRELLRALLQATADALPLPKPKTPRAARKKPARQAAAPAAAREAASTEAAAPPAARKPRAGKPRTKPD